MRLLLFSLCALSAHDLTAQNIPDTLREWTPDGKLHHMQIRSDSAYREIHFWYDTGKILEIGLYVWTGDPIAPILVRDSSTFSEYKIACKKNCFVPAGQWYTFHENGMPESEGKYVPAEFQIAYPTMIDSAGVAAIIPATSFEMIPELMYIACLTRLKDGLWIYYNEQGEKIREEYYEGGLLQNTILFGEAAHDK